MFRSRKRRNFNLPHADDKSLNKTVASWRCYAAISMCWACYFTIGLTVGFPSTALPDIASGHYGFVMGDSIVNAWYGSTFGLSNILGGLGIATLMDFYGRKLAFLLLSTLSAIGWLCTVVATNITWMFVGRVILGSTNGAQMVIVAVYVSEVAPKQIRGNATSGNFASLLFGIAMSYVFGTFMNWRWLAVIGVGSVLLVTAGGVLFLPETPRWLIVHQYLDIARDNLSKLRSFPSSTSKAETIAAEVKEMEDSIEMMKSVTFFGVLKILLRKPYLRPLIVCQFTMFFQQLSATGYIKTFLVNIFQMSLGIKNSANDHEESIMTNPHYQAIIIGMCGVVGGLLSIVTTDGCGRRLSLILSSLLVTIALSAIGAFFWLSKFYSHWTANTLAWLPLSGLVVYNIGYGIGLGPIPYVLMSELFPTRARGAASGITFVVHSIFFVLVVQIFGGVSIGPHISFTIFAGVSFVGLLFHIFFVPETKGRSLESIEKQLAAN